MVTGVVGRAANVLHLEVGEEQQLICSGSETGPTTQFCSTFHPPALRNKSPLPSHCQSLLHIHKIPVIKFFRRVQSWYFDGYESQNDECRFVFRYGGAPMPNHKAMAAY